MLVIILNRGGKGHVVLVMVTITNATWPFPSLLRIITSTNIYKRPPLELRTPLLTRTLRLSLVLGESPVLLKLKLF